LDAAWRSKRGSRSLVDIDQRLRRETIEIRRERDPWGKPMAKKEKVESAAGDIPAWFMTYSDVITLLMTFFILLLTFATSEPEQFGTTQVIHFGGGSSTGVARSSAISANLDSQVVRIRPRASRFAKDGSEQPPQMTDPGTDSLAKGLDAIENRDKLAQMQRIRMQVPVGILQDSNHKPTSYAARTARMLGHQLVGLPIEINFVASNVDDADICVQLASMIYESFEVAPGRLSVQVAPTELATPSMILIGIERERQSPDSRR